MKLFIGLVLLIVVIGGALALMQYNDNPTPTVINAPATPPPSELGTIAPPASGTSTGVTASTTVQVGVQRTVDVIVTASNFAFSPQRIEVKNGDRVRVTLVSEGGLHDWALDQFNARTNRLNSGERQTIEFIANQTGTFEYYCAVGNHRQMGMVGTLVVTP